MRWFWIATMVALFLLTLAGVSGGIWPWMAFLYLTAFVPVMDHLLHGTVAIPNRHGQLPSGHTLAIVLGVAHFPILGLGVAAIAGATGLSGVDRLLCFLSFGLFIGQISNANAHELIHKAKRLHRQLGVLVYISMLFGHHASAHPKVHHIWVATERDPNSARLGESFYRFWPRSWLGSFRAGLAAETKLRAGARSTPAPLSHPYVAYVGGALLLIFGAALSLGVVGVAALIALTAYAQMQLLLSDYVQHYGLTRAVDAKGKPQPVGMAHSWNAPHFFSSALMLNAPRHSDHHVNPSRSYPSLQIDDPHTLLLPRSLPVMATLALFPTFWRRVMDPRVAKIRASRD